MENITIVKKNSIFTNYILSLILTSIFSILSFVLYIYVLRDSRMLDISDTLIFGLCWLGIITYLGMCVNWYRITSKLITPYTIFLTFFFLFNYGQQFMWAFGIHTSYEIGNVPIYPSYSEASPNDIFITQLYTILCSMMLHVGALLAINYKRKTGVSIVEEKKDIHKAIKIVSIIIGFFSIPITLIQSIYQLSISRTYGYSALFYSEYAAEGVSLSGIFSLLFFPSLLGLLIGNKYARKSQLFVYSIMIIYSFINTLAGSRGAWLYMFISLVWLAQHIYSFISFKKLLQFIFGGTFGLLILDGIISLRNSGFSFKAFWTTIVTYENSPIIEAVFEMGHSMNPTLFLFKYGWDVWPYENSYFLAMLGIFTNKLIEVFGFSFMIADNWFKDYIGTSFGPGFSILAEPLINFGPVVAPLFLVLIGYIVSKILYVDKDFSLESQPLRLLFVAGSMDFLLKINRSGVHHHLKKWVLGTVMFCVAIIIVERILKNIGTKNK